MNAAMGASNIYWFEGGEYLGYKLIQISLHFGIKVSIKEISVSKLPNYVHCDTVFKTWNLSKTVNTFYGCCTSQKKSW